VQRIEKIIEEIGPLDKGAMKQAKARQNFLTKPKESLGILEDVSIRVAGITGSPMPEIADKVIITMAGDHGAAKRGVSAFPQDVTAQMVYNFIRGGAGINVLARHAGARVVVVDIGVAADLEPSPVLVNKKVNHGTKDMTKGPAMTKEEAVRSITAGIEVVEEELKKGVDVIGTGDMGIGNTTASSAITAVFTGRDVREVTGRGTGVDDAALENKIGVIEECLKVNRPDKNDPIDVLAKVGGFEIGGLVGVILAGAKNRVPVVIDGFISGAAALIATQLTPQSKDYLIAAHRSVESGHTIMLEHIGLTPLMDLNMRLGEGTGAALGIFLTEASTRILSEMATFADAGVSESESE